MHISRWAISITSSGDRLSINIMHIYLGHGSVSVHQIIGLQKEQEHDDDDDDDAIFGGKYICKYLVGSKCYVLCVLCQRHAWVMCKKLVSIIISHWTYRITNNGQKYFLEHKTMFLEVGNGVWDRTNLFFSSKIVLADVPNAIALLPLVHAIDDRSKSIKQAIHDQMNMEYKGTTQWWFGMIVVFEPLTMILQDMFKWPTR